MPYAKEDNYFSFIPGSNEYGTTMRVETKPKGNDFFGVMPDFARLLADKGHNIIIDEVLLSDEVLKKYARHLINHTVYYIGVFCDLVRMQEREVLRRDRCLGLSNDQVNRVHLGLRTHYDVKVDTTTLSPFQISTQILTYINSTSNPQAFKDILKAGNKNR